jgi:hypothetical protein
MLPGKNGGAEFRKFLIGLRIIRGVSQGRRQTNLEHFWQIRYFDCLQKVVVRGFLRLRERNIQEYALTAIRLGAGDRVASTPNDTEVTGNSTNLQSSPAKPLFSCAADRPHLGSGQADRPRSSLARATAKRTASRRPCPLVKAGGSRPSPRPTAWSQPRGPFAFPMFPIGPRCPSRSRPAAEQGCAEVIRQSAIWLRITRARCDGLSSNESGRSPIGPSKAKH